jgi:hypothetical protein
MRQNNEYLHSYLKAIFHGDKYIVKKKTEKIMYSVVSWRHEANSEGNVPCV